MFLEILQNLQENTCASLFLNKVRPATLSKKRLWHRGFHVNFAKFLRTPFTEHLTATASVCLFSPLAVLLENKSNVENIFLTEGTTRSPWYWNASKQGPSFQCWRFFYSGFFLLLLFVFLLGFARLSFAAVFDY